MSGLQRMRDNLKNLRIIQFKEPVSYEKCEELFGLAVFVGIPCCCGEPIGKWICFDWQKLMFLCDDCADLFVYLQKLDKPEIYIGYGDCQCGECENKECLTNAKHQNSTIH